MNFFVVFGVLACASLAKCQSADSEDLIGVENREPRLLADSEEETFGGGANTNVESAPILEYAQAVSTLIESHADINELDNGETVLHVAVAAGDEKYARLLVHNGADFTIINRYGKTAKDIATERGFTKLARVLQESVAQRACRTYSNLSFVDHRILDGETVTSREEFPWMAALGYLDLFRAIKYSCGGTLISEKFVLTAAHCTPIERPPVVVRLGELDLVETVGPASSAYYQVIHTERHPNYSHGKKINDIALIELAARVYFSETIRPACLQTYLSDEDPNVDLTITGWGVVSTKWGNTSSVLLKAKINTVSWSECNSTIFSHAQRSGEGKPFQNGIDQCHYCAMHPKRLTDTCQGDSGGPLQIINNQTKIATVVGVVSTGYSCGTEIPGIYARVALFVDWIESYVWPNDEIAPPLINMAGSA